METWQKQLSQSVTKVKDLPYLPDLSEKYKEKLEEVAKKFPIRINSYFLEQVKSTNDPLWKQVVPTLEEMDDWLDDEDLQESDPLNEEGDMPVPELVHRYPDRVLLMLNNQCPIICRFCTRKRKIGFPGIVTRETLRQGIEYIRNHPEVRDVIMSGGDPLLVPDKELERKHNLFYSIGKECLSNYYKDFYPFGMNGHYNEKGYNLVAQKIYNLLV